MNSPNELIPPAASGLAVSRMSRKPLVLVLLVGLVLISVLVYSVNFSKRERREDKVAPLDTQVDKPLLPDSAGSGLVIPPAPASVAKAEPVAPDKPIVVVAPKRDERADAQRREREQLRRRKMQAALDALASPLGVAKGDGAGAAAATQEVAAKPRGESEENPAALLSQTQSEYDPAADRDKEAFFTRAGAADTQWTLPDERTPGRPFELKTGAVIPGVMLTGLNSDLPGNIIAQVGQNVYDTARGEHLLIPQGTRLFGVYDSRVVYGQERVLAAWNRLVFPDGSALTLGAMNGADMAGYAGFHDEVDNHYLRIFGSAVLMSLISGGMAYATDTMGGDSDDSDGTSLREEMVSALASQLGQTSAKLLEKNLSIKPTLQIRPGYRFNVVVTKDIVFERPYAPLR